MIHVMENIQDLSRKVAMILDQSTSIRTTAFVIHLGSDFSIATQEPEFVPTFNKQNLPAQVSVKLLQK
jgi:hypothetical protein